MRKKFTIYPKPLPFSLALLAMSALLLAAATLATFLLKVDALWYDEVRMYAKVGGGRFGDGRTIPEMLQYTIRYRDSWPPLYNLVFAGWGQVAGWSDYAMRLKALYLGLLALAMTYRLGADVGQSRWVGLLGAVLLASAAFFFHYLHEARGYTLAVLLAMTSAVLYWRLMTATRPGLGLLSAFFLANAALLYTHYTTAFLLGGIGVYHLLFARKEGRWWWIFGALALSALSIVPWFSALVRVVSAEGENTRGEDISTVLQDFVYAFGNGLWVVLPLGLLASLRAWRLPGMRYLWVMVLWFFGVALVANHFLDFLFHVRHILGGLPLLCVLMTLGVWSLNGRWRWAGWLGVAVWVVAGLWAIPRPAFMEALPRHERMIPMATMHTIMDWADTCATPQDKVVFYYKNRLDWINNLTMLHYLWADVPFDYAQMHQMEPIAAIYNLDSAMRVGSDSPSDYAARIRWFVEDAAQVWVFHDPVTVPSDRAGQFEAVMREDFVYCGPVMAQPGLDVYLYANMPEGPACAGSVMLQPCTGPLFAGVP